MLKYLFSFSVFTTGVAFRVVLFPQKASLHTAQIVKRSVVVFIVRKMLRGFLYR